MSKTTHYTRSDLTLCGRSRFVVSTVKEFGEVSCRVCNKIIQNAGMKALGFK